MLALARHLGEYPARAANLTGLAVAEMAVDTLEEAVQQPGCPNLYWALTNLPAPLVGLRGGVQGDCALASAEFSAIKADAPMTAEEIERVVGRLSGVLGYAREQAGTPPRSLRAAVEARVKDADRVGSARARLAANGVAKELVARFPPAQAVLLCEVHDFEARRDEGVKLLGLTPWQIDALGGGREAERDPDDLFAELRPDVVRARRLQAHLDERIAVLCHVEALRLYAAAHDGRLPTSLADVGVPLPPDLFTGQAFTYQRRGATAALRGGAPAGKEKDPTFRFFYEIVVAK